MKEQVRAKLLYAQYVAAEIKDVHFPESDPVFKKPVRVYRQLHRLHVYWL